jgi:hypothetical protein
MAGAGSFDDLIRAAEGRVAGMDRIDRRSGSATPDDMGPGELVRVAEAALEAGIRSLDWSVAGDALVYLRRASKRIVF